VGKGCTSPAPQIIGFPYKTWAGFKDVFPVNPANAPTSRRLRNRRQPKNSITNTQALVLPMPHKRINYRAGALAVENAARFPRRAPLPTSSTAYQIVF